MTNQEYLDRDGRVNKLGERTMTEERWTADDAQCEVVRENMRSVNAGKQAGMSINVTLPNEIYDWLKAYAEECEVSISAMVRSLIVAYRQDIENGEEE